MPSKSDFDQLEWELYETRRLVLRLLPTDVQRVLENYDTGSVDKWRRYVEPELICLAQRLELPQWCGSDERALCPLCGEGPVQELRPGFRVPGGLLRHLQGTHRFQRCDVMLVAEELAKYEFDRERRFRARGDPNDHDRATRLS